MSLEDYRKYVATTVRGVRSGKMDPKQGAVVCQLIGLLVRFWELNDHDQRVRELDGAVVALRTKVKELLDQRGR